ncbi:Protein LRON-14 a [Aphelenchoides avenae]|nr:Protein LRON-14 a [Aphelenchus avenae]
MTAVFHVFVVLLLHALNHSLGAYFVCPTGCNCTPDPSDGYNAVHVLCKWNRIETQVLFSLRNEEMVRTLTIRCSHQATVTTTEMPAAETLRTLPPGLFQRLRHLDRLEIDRCRFQEIERETFYGMNYLYSLIVKNAGLEEIHANAFDHMTNLMTLDLSGNELRAEPAALTALHDLIQLDLSNNSITYLSSILSNSHKLKVFSLAYNYIETVDFRLLPPGLTDLSLPRNKITTIRNALHSNVQLRRLDLSNNHLSFIATEGSVNVLPVGLRVIKLRDNEISQVQEGAFRRINRMVLVDLRNNSLAELPEEAVLVDEVKQRYRLLLSGNPLRCSCANAWMLGTNMTIPVTVVDLDRMRCRKPIDPSQWISMLEADRQQLFLCRYDNHCLKGCDCCLTRPARCACARICPAGCRCWRSVGASVEQQGQNVVVCDNVRMDRLRYVPDSVTELHLAGSMWRDKGLRHLGLKENLSKLNLSSSNIGFLNETLLNQFPHLEVLDLSSNGLREVDTADLELLRKLRTVFLHNNRFAGLDNRTMAYFSRLQNFSIGGDGNVFRCGCGHEQTWMQKWLLRKDIREKVIDLERVSCMLPNNETIKLLDTEKAFGGPCDDLPHVITTSTTTMPATSAFTLEIPMVSAVFTVTSFASTTMGTTMETTKETTDVPTYYDEETTATTMKEETSETTAATWTWPATVPDIERFLVITTKMQAELTTDDEISHQPLPSLPVLEEHAFRALAKSRPTPPPRRRDIDSQVVYNVLMMILLLVLVFLVCAIVTTVYYRLFKRQDVKVTRVTYDESRPLHTQRKSISVSRQSFSVA